MLKDQGPSLSPVTTSGTALESWDSFRYLGVNIHKDMTWAGHTATVIKRLHKACTASGAFRNSARGTVPLGLVFGHRKESSDRLPQHLAWQLHNMDHKALWRGWHVIGCELPGMQELQTRWCLRTSLRVIRDKRPNCYPQEVQETQIIHQLTDIQLSPKQ